MPLKKRPRLEKGQMSLLTSFGRTSAATTTSTPGIEPDADQRPTSTSANRPTSDTENKGASTASRTFRQSWLIEFQPWLR